jgi:hypothetical protein
MHSCLNLLRKALDNSVHSRPNGLARLEYPLFPVPRVAVLGLRVEETSGVHVLEHWNAAKLTELRPLALAGWWPELREVGQLVEAGLLTLADLRYPVIVFSTPERGALPEEHHELLWNWFEVPTIEQIRSSTGELLAVECESRNGFHLCPGVRAEQLGATVAVELECACGARQALYRVETRRARAAAE